MSPAVAADTVTVSTDAANCALAESVQLWTVTLTVAGGSPRQGPVESFTIWSNLDERGGPIRVHMAFVTGQKIEPGTCSWTFTGLPPASYVALLTSSSGSRGFEVFTLAPDLPPATVVVAPPLVRVTGRIMHACAPRARTHISVTGLPNGRPAVVVVSDAYGRYTVTLDRPGVFEFAVYGLGMVRTELAAGPNAFDIGSASAACAE